MKAVFLTLGSRGDVQPYVAIGIELMKLGHDVTICTGETFESFVTSHGLTFVKAEADFMKILESPEGDAIFNGGKLPLKQMMAFVKETINPAFRKSFDDFWKASQGADVIIAHPKAMVAHDIADKLGIPCIDMPPVPILYPVSEFPNLSVAPDKNFGHLINRLTYLPVKFSESSTMKEINDFRKVTLDLPKRRMGKYSHYDKQHVIYPISPSLFKEVHSWDGKVKITGFPFLEIGLTDLESSVSDFIDQGNPPWVITFSSMPAKGLDTLISSVLASRGERAIFLTGSSQMAFDDPNILCIPKAPHRLIFQKARGIIHHGGVGTMAEALLSGKPQHIIPFNVDQPFWANKLYQLGLMSRPIKANDLTEASLNTIFETMSSRDSLDKAEAMAEAIRAENGILTCAHAIEEIVKNA